MTREQKVINILKSTKNIEKILRKTFIKYHSEVQRHSLVRKENMPNFVSFLYDQIIALNTLPSVKQFIDGYLKKYYKNIHPDQVIFHACVQRIYNAYCSIVRDLHFYFKLKESKLFDHVQLSYAYDIEAKQDIVVTLGRKKLGIQLFSGGDKDIKWKKKQASRRKIILGYPDFYLPLYGSQTSPINICNKKNEFLVYSDRDVQRVYQALREVQNDSYNVEIEEDFYILPKLPQKKSIKDSHKNKSSQRAKHSYVYVGSKNVLEDSEIVCALLKYGIRIEWISPHSIKEQNLKKVFGKYLANLRVHCWKKASSYSLELIDGNYDAQTESILKIIGKNTTFNYEQYKTEHASTKKHLIVEAGAGTGKTETMVSRLLFLLHTGKIDRLEEVVMITFTNEASDNIKTKLVKRFIRLYRMTGNTRYINWSEEASGMRIMTIPSFAKTIIQDFSQEIGMGVNFSIRSLIKERRDIIEAVLEKYTDEQKLSFYDLGGIREHELVKIIDGFWNELEKKGISFDSFNQIDWGEIPDEKIQQNLFNLIKEVISRCKQEFNYFKLTNNVLTVNDLTQKINEIKDFLNEEQLSRPFKFLFVDEFQDTDDVQIELVNVLISILNDAQLFVVGDIKQSIYRFRGANYTAFNVLTSRLGGQNIRRDLTLRKNYRTDARILNFIENIFDVWRNDEEQILPKEDSEGLGRLIPAVSSQKYANAFLFEKVASKKYESRVMKFLRELYDSMVRDKENEIENRPEVLAVLVRTNKQAQDIKRILDKMRNKVRGRKENRDIVYEVVTGGTLFSSEAARDLLILFNALCYKDDPESYFALFQTPFTPAAFDPSLLIDCNGNKKEITRRFSYDEVRGYRETIEALRIKPALHAVYQFISVNPFEKVLASQNVQSHEIERYRLNLYRILELAMNEAGSGINSIYTLKNWLQLQVATNRDEPEMEADTSKYEKIIRVMTVHKAKGLEFDTVFIPNTFSSFIKNRQQEIIVSKDEHSLKAGWKIKQGTGKNNKILKSQWYEELKKNEDLEILREEARLLYVALTRAKNKLVVFYRDSNNEDLKNWSDLVRYGLEGRESF